MQEFKAGVLCVYKPKGISSNGLLNKIRRLAGTRRVGHAGTLDPLASGVLVVGIGGGTSELAKLAGAEKEYLATIRLGVSSTTDDEEGQKTYENAPRQPTTAEIEGVLKNFTGDIQQVTPAYSAVNIGGKKAYELARRGKVVDLGKRQVTVHQLKLLSFSWPDMKIRVVVSSGTYIRALARDIGEALGTRGYLADLERIRVGEYRRETCIRIEV